MVLIDEPVRRYIWKVSFEYSKYNGKCMMLSCMLLLANAAYYSNWSDWIVAVPYTLHTRIKQAHGLYCELEMEYPDTKQAGRQREKKNSKLESEW